MTSTVSIYTTAYNGRQVHLIDTPGFDDTHRTEISVLQELAAWLSAAYQPSVPELGFLLSGIIYCHSINRPRWDGASTRSLRLLQAISGRDNYDAITFATTFWDVADHDRAIELEVQLKGSAEKFGSMLQTRPSSSYFRVNASKGSVAEIIASIVKRNRKFVLQIQRELAKPSTTLLDTSAGKVAERLWEDDIESLQASINDVKTQMRKNAMDSSLKDEIFRFQDDMKTSTAALSALTDRRELLQKCWMERSLQEVHEIDERIGNCRARLAVLSQNNNSGLTINVSATDLNPEEKEQKELRQRQKDLQAIRNAKIASRSMRYGGLGALFGFGSMAIAAAPMLAAHGGASFAAAGTACVLCCIM